MIESRAIHRGLAVRLGAALVLVVAVVALYLSPLQTLFTIANAREALSSFQAVWYGPLLFVALYAIGATLFVPATVFIVSSGLIWGWKLGGLYSVMGAVLAASASFLIARFIGGGLLVRFGDIGRKVAAQVEKGGFQSLLILRFMPIFPFAVLNYGSGVAGVSFPHFLGATLIGVTPSTLIVAYSADAIFNGSLSGQDAFRRLLIAGVLMVALVGIPALLRARGDRALQQDDAATGS